MCRVTMGHLRATMGHLRLTIGYLKATVVHIRVTLGHLRVTIGHFRVTIGHHRITIGHYFFSISKHKANTTELHPKVRQTCSSFQIKAEGEGEQKVKTQIMALSFSLNEVSSPHPVWLPCGDSCDGGGGGRVTRIIVSL